MLLQTIPMAYCNQLFGFIESKELLWSRTCYTQLVTSRRAIASSKLWTPGALSGMSRRVHGGKPARWSGALIASVTERSGQLVVLASGHRTCGCRFPSLPIILILIIVMMLFGCGLIVDPMVLADLMNSYIRLLHLGLLTQLITLVAQECATETVMKP